MLRSAGMGLLATIERDFCLTVTSPIEKRQRSVALLGRVAPLVLGDEDAVGREQLLVGDELERLAELAGLVRAVRRIEEDPAEYAAGFFVDPADDGHTANVAAAER